MVAALADATFIGRSTCAIGWAQEGGNHLSPGQVIWVPRGHVKRRIGHSAVGFWLLDLIIHHSLLKEGQKVIVQVLGDGPLKGVVAESDWLCRVRCYVKRPHIHLGLKDGKLDVGRAIGNGLLNVIKDLGLRDYYQGSVPLQTGEIATDLAYYLNNSEQIPAAVSLGVYVETDNSVKASGGFMIHSLPGASDEIIDYLEGRLKGVRSASSMILDGLTPEEIMQEAVGLPLKVLDKKQVSYYCPCTRERVLGAIVAMGKQGIQELIAKGEAAHVQCQFCMKEYTVPADEILALLKNAESPDMDRQGTAVV
jgi:molecular chaperone Hsp33